MKSLSGLPEIGKGLTETERHVLSCVLEYWPTCPLEIAAHLGLEANSREEKKRLSSKYSYYLRKLNEKGLIFSKRMGNALVVWPSEVEKYRTIHEILHSEVPNA